MIGQTDNESPYLSHNETDQFDKKMNSIMQSSISTMFRQLIEPVDSNSSKIDIDSPSTKTSPPPLKLHDFGGSDFVRLAEKSRRNRSSSSSTTTTTTTTATEAKPTSPQRTAYIDPAKRTPSLPSPINQSTLGSKQTSTINGVDWNKSSSMMANNPSSKKHLQEHSDWKIKQECTLQTGNSKEVTYEKFIDGTATESLHRALYPEDIVKDIKKSTIVSSPSTTSSLSSMAESAKMNSPLKRLWHLVFD